MTVVLDAQGMSVVARSAPRHAAQSAALATLLVSLERQREVFVPAAVLAELYRGGPHDQVIDSCLNRFPAIVVVPTDRPLAREIGHLLARAGRGSTDHVDASVVAVAVHAGGGLIATGDVDDIAAIAEGIPRIRVLAV